ncbi:MAG: DEAD/DEAH box helicase [Clostridia bacterium]|nr:DEAD/DEAH box helicase [Clostridia bacterium]
MRIVVRNEIYVTGYDEGLLDWCKKTLVITNPEYTKKQRMGKWLGNTPRYLYMYRVDGDTLILPHGKLNDIILRYGNDAIRYEYPEIRSVDYGGSVELYDYQELAVDALADSRGGVLQSKAGSGKTQMGIALIAKLGCKALWLTHTKDLLKQSEDRAAQYFDRSLFGEITEGKVNIGKGITFATVQTLATQNLNLYRDSFDCIIVDECHRVAGTPTAATQFGKVIGSLNARYKYGLSATVHRADGLIVEMFSYLGNIAYTVPDEAVADKVMTVWVNRRDTGVHISPECLDTDGTLLYTNLISYLASNTRRNFLIANDLANNSNHYNLILSDRISHLQYLMSLLPAEMCVMVDGSMTSKKAKAERERAIEDMRSGKKRYLFATYKLAKEGLDIPRLDRLFLATPQKDYAIIVQSVGRIQRTFEGKSDPICYDYVDSIEYLARAYKKRCSHYRKCGCNLV